MNKNLEKIARKILPLVIAANISAPAVYGQECSESFETTNTLEKVIEYTNNCNVDNSGKAKWTYNVKGKVVPTTSQDFVQKKYNEQIANENVSKETNQNAKLADEMKNEREHKEVEEANKRALAASKQLPVKAPSSEDAPKPVAVISASGDTLNQEALFSKGAMVGVYGNQSSEKSSPKEFRGSLSYISGNGLNVIQAELQYGKFSAGIRKGNMKDIVLQDSTTPVGIAIFRAKDELTNIKLEGYVASYSPEFARFGKLETGFGLAYDTIQGTRKKSEKFIVGGSVLSSGNSSQQIVQEIASLQLRAGYNLSRASRLDLILENNSLTLEGKRTGTIGGIGYSRKFN